nr:hypothetical protein [uncultured Sphaerochaeta sp.]
MIDDFIIVLSDDTDKYDISDLLVPGSLTIQEQACNSDYNSTLDSASWSIRFDETIFILLRDSVEVLQIEIYDRESQKILFKGQIEPTPSADWSIPEYPSDINLDAVDFTVALDDPLPQSVAFPANVGDIPFWIYKRGEEQFSILYWLLYLAGLSDSISDDAPDIALTVLHFSATEGEPTIRDLIDGLLHDYGYVIHRIHGDRITWSCSAPDEIEDVLPIGEDDILAGSGHRFSIQKQFNVNDGVKIAWPRTRVMDDALLWKGGFPVGGSEDPFPGEDVAGGDYWPEDSDIQETWFDFGDEYLDTPYLEGTSRLKNEDLALIASSGHYIRDSRDQSIIFDPLDETNTVVYESLRARFRYKNSGVSPAKIYWSKILGKALVRVALPSQVYPSNARNPKEYSVSHIYSANDAYSAVKREWMRMRKGAFDINFDSFRDLQIGSIYSIRQGDSHWDGYILIVGRSRTYDQSGIWRYSAVSIAPTEELTVRLSSSIGNTNSQDPSSAAQNLTIRNALLKPGTTDQREDFEIKMTTGQVSEDGSWDLDPSFYIKTGEDILLGIDNNFLDVADDNKKKRALINGNGGLAITNNRVYIRNANADGLSANRCNLRGNMEAEVFINPALIAQPSSRAITSLQTLKVQQKSLAYDLCVWAQANGIGFNNLYRCEISEESDVGWVMFAANTALGTWGSSEIECFVYFYGDTGDSLYRCSSKCTYEAYTVQNEWIFGWPWFGTHTEYHWVTYGSLSGLIDTDYEEDDGTVSRGIGFSVAPVQAIDPSSINIDIPGYGVDLRNNTDVTVDGVTCDGFSEEGGQSMAFRCYFGSDYDLYMKKLPGNDTATVEALASGALYRGAGGALYVK